MKKSFWESDWFAGLIISLVFRFASSSTFLQSLMRKAYDSGVPASTREAGGKAAIIAICNQSIAKTSDWSWHHDVHAKMIEKLSVGLAKAVSATIYFLKPQIDLGLGYINKIPHFVAVSMIPIVAPEALQPEAMLKEAQRTRYAWGMTLRPVESLL